MLDSSFHAERRRALRERVGGPVLLLGTGTRVRNLPMNLVPFRQDSTFLYFTGCAIPDATLLIDDAGDTLFLPAPAEDDALWHGEVPSFEAYREQFAVDRVRPREELAPAVNGRRVRTLAIGDEARNREAAAWSTEPLAFGRQYGDPELVAAVIAMRRPKSGDELAEMRRAARATEAAHRAVMRATHAGSSERGLAALFSAVLAHHGCEPGYGTILTQRGEVLHLRDHSATLEKGRLVLLDGGGEVDSGYGADVTRAWPVTGRFDGRQKAAYQAVLDAQVAAVDLCTPGTPYRLVHDTASRVLARFLAEEGLITIPADDAVARGAHALFFPHGVGHHIGLDVHDLETFGDLPSYPPNTPRPDAFGTRYLRLNLPLEERWVVTVEPGFYVVPAILHDRVLRERFEDAVDFDVAERWIGFGGIRIEDDIVVGTKPENLTKTIPKSVEEVEAIVGTGADAEALFG